MVKIVIIGNCLAGFSACETLLRAPFPHHITLISKEPFAAYKRNLLIDYLAGKIKESDLFLHPEDFYQRDNLTFRKNSEVIKVDTKKNRVICKDNTKIDYDYLIIASGQRVTLPDIPGKNKEGIFTVYSLEDIKGIIQSLAVSNTVSIFGPKKISLRVADIITLKGKEVKIISEEVSEGVNHDNLEFINRLRPQEFIGEGQLQAVKLNNGKVIATSLALFLGGYAAASDFLKESEIKTYQGYVLVDNFMRTNLANVFASGTVCRRNETVLVKEKIWKEAVSEGSLAAQGIIRLTRGETLKHED